LYLPRVWTQDPDRCAAAGIPADIGFATKPALARQLVLDALDGGAPARWVAGDEVYGNDPNLRKALRERGIGYVLAVAKTHRITTGIGPRRAIDLAVRLPARAWQRLSAGSGAKGERWYDWALIDTTDDASTPGDGPPGCHWLLIRRNRATGELAFYRAYSPVPVRLSALVRVAGRRWSIEESFAASKELAALDQHQVRSWRSWQRWTALVILAHAFLSVMTATEPPPPADQIPLTRNEIRHLLAAVTQPHHNARHTLAWSTWRRTHQARAQTSHYQRQELTLCA
jgi:SRSO17 transposase